MNAFHGDPKIKEKFLARIRAHRTADEIIKGKYWENGKGCAVGCTIHSGSHAEYESQLGIPRVLARLEDGIFEALPNEFAMTWPERFLEAIPVGADLSQIWDKFAIWLLTDEVHGIIKFAKTGRVINCINNVANLYLRSLKELIKTEEWAYAAGAAGAAYAAGAAAYAAADADADAGAAYAAYAAYAAGAAAAAAGADAAADAADAAAAAAAAADADADADARTKNRIAQSEKLLELLRDA